MTAGTPPEATLLPGLHLESTLLRANATAEDIDHLCDEAAALTMLGACVMPGWVRRAARRLGGKATVVSVAGFPLGSTTTSVKVAEACGAVDAGAAEVDMVMNVGALLSGDGLLVGADIESVAVACHSRGARLKVILELGYLTGDQKREACRLAVAAGTDFVKTSTGFGAGGATVEDVRLLRHLAPASVGQGMREEFRDLVAALAMLSAGADRIGTQRRRRHRPGGSETGRLAAMEQAGRRCSVE